MTTKDDIKDYVAMRSQAVPQALSSGWLPSFAWRTSPGDLYSFLLDSALDVLNLLGEDDPSRLEAVLEAVSNLYDSTIPALLPLQYKPFNRLIKRVTLYLIQRAVEAILRRDDAIGRTNA